MDEKMEKAHLERKLLGKLKHNYEYCKQYYLREHRKMHLLDATDKGDLWKACGAKFPPYQLLPEQTPGKSRS